jgi:hypothetical protein
MQISTDRNTVRVQCEGEGNTDNGANGSYYYEGNADNGANGSYHYEGNTDNGANGSYHYEGNTDNGANGSYHYHFESIADDIPDKYFSVERPKTAVLRTTRILGKILK